MIKKILFICLFLLLLPCISAVKYTSLIHADIDIDDVVFDSGSYILLKNITINRTYADTVVFKSSLNVEKFTFPQKSSVELLYSLNGNTIYNEEIITITGLNNIKSVRTSPFETNFSIGQNNLTIYAREKINGVGAINISSYSILIDTDKTTSNNTISTQLFNNFSSFSNNTFQEIFNFTITNINKSGNLIEYSSFISANSVTDVLCYINNSMTSSYFRRTLSSLGQIGSAGLFIHDNIESLSKSYSVQCRDTDGDIISINQTVYTISKNDDANFTIPISSYSRVSTNLTATDTFNAGTNQVFNTSHVMRNGTSLLFLLEYSLYSTSGTQTPKFTIQSPDTDVICDDGHSRSFSASNQHGVVHFYAGCHNLTIGNNHNFTINLIVETGESVVLNDEYVAFYEVTEFNINELPIPLIPSNAQDFYLIYNIYGSVNGSEQIRVYPELGFTSSDIMNITFDDSSSFLMTLDTEGFFRINITDNVTEDINFTVLYVNSLLNKTGTIKMRVPFHLVMTYYKDSSLKTNATNQVWDNDIFNYVYMINDSQTTDKFLNSLNSYDYTKWFSWIPFYNIVPKISFTSLQNTLYTQKDITYFYDDLESGTVNITLYETGNYSMYLLGMKVFDTIPAYQYLHFVIPDYTNRNTDTFLMNFEIDDTTDKFYNIRLDLYTVSKYHFARNIVFWLIIVLIWVALTVGVSMISIKAGIGISIAYWMVILTLRSIF